MIQLGLYTYQGLYERELSQNFTHVFVQKLLRSTSRCTGSSIYVNKYIKALAFANRIAKIKNTEGEITAVNLALSQELKKYERSFPLTSIRVELAVDANFKHEDASAIRNLFNQAKARFELKSDLEWFDSFTSRAGYAIAGCGHFEQSYGMIRFIGTADDPSVTQHVCADCASTASRTGERVLNHQGHYILAAFARSIHGNRGNIVDDFRHYRYILARDMYVTSDYSPYANLIDGYHSSKAKGFTPIDSPWFRTRRKAFGCELEVQRIPNFSGNVNTLAGKVHEVLNPSLTVGEYCYFERDGSISDGFEIVTQPAGLDVHRAKFDLFLNNAQIKEGMRSHAGGACGFHVHVGRQYLSQAQIYRMQAFLNDPRNRALILKVSRRYSNGGYAKFKPELASLSPVGKHTSDRYEALNVMNTETVEFRIFRGSLRYESIMAALEFVNAVIEFCMPGQIPFNEFNAIGFRRYINRPENEEDTIFLRPYISDNASSDNETAVKAAS